MSRRQSNRHHPYQSKSSTSSSAPSSPVSPTLSDVPSCWSGTTLAPDTDGEEDPQQHWGDKFHYPTQQRYYGRPGRSPAFAAKLRQMAGALMPLVQVTTGLVCPEFPQTLLHYWLLTGPQLDELARFYHQSGERGRRSDMAALYPCPVAWAADLPLEEKRRRMGYFIGLKVDRRPYVGSPRWQRQEEEWEEVGKEGDGGEFMDVDPRVPTEDEILENVSRARLAEEASEEALRRKLGYYS